MNLPAYDRDIVTRLRDYDPDVCEVQIVLDAADEIERLRRRLPGDIAAELRICALLADATGNSCQARAFETAAEIAEAGYPEVEGSATDG